MAGGRIPGRRLAFVVALSIAVDAGAGAPIHMPCDPGQKPVAACYSVHARLYVTNGIPVRLWPVGSKRHLGVLNLDSLHPLIHRYLGIQDGRVQSTLYGDFEVCPLTPERRGHMRFVCLRSAANLVVEQHRGDDTPRKVFRLLNTWPAGAAKRKQGQ